MGRGRNTPVSNIKSGNLGSEWGEEERSQNCGDKARAATYTATLSLCFRISDRMKGSDV